MQRRQDVGRLRAASNWRRRGPGFLASGVALLVLSALAAGPAHGEIGTPDLTGRIGGFAFFAPEFEGAKDYAPAGYPLIEFTFREQFFLDVRRGVGMDVLRAGRLSAAVALGYHFGRDAGDSDALTGLPDINGGLQIQGFATFKLLPTTDLDLTLRRGLTGGDDGFLAEIGASHATRIAPGWITRYGLSATYADGQYMEKYFTVTTPQAATSGLSAFSAGPGFKDIEASATLIWSFADNWAAIGRVSAKRLLGDAADSSIVSEKGDPNQFTFGLGASYSFSF